jgi:hypothetical protein
MLYYAILCYTMLCCATGNYFHPRCVGSSAAQSGEWFCLDCSTIMQAEGAADAAAGGGGADWADFSSPSASLLSRVTRQYHVMRLERNRLMLSWQQERRLAEGKAGRDLAAQRVRDGEHAAALDRCGLLEGLLLREQSAALQLKKSRDHEFSLRLLVEREFTAAAAATSSSANGSSGSSSSSRDAEVLGMPQPARRMSQSDKSPAGSPDAHTHTHTGTGNGSANVKPPPLLGSSSMKVLSLSLAGAGAGAAPAGGGGSPSDTAPAPGPGQGGEDPSGIPKPWLSTKRSHREGRGAGAGAGLAEPPPQSPLQAKSPASRSPDQQQQQAGAGRGREDASGEDSRRRVQVSPIRPSPSHRGDGNPDPGRPSMGESADTYLFPIRNRLKDLLKSVELEAGSFTQIRSKQKEREMLRSSHVSRRGGGRAGGGAVDFGDLVPPGARADGDPHPHAGMGVASIDNLKSIASIASPSGGQGNDDNKNIFRTFVPSRRKKNTEKNCTEYPEDEQESAATGGGRKIMSTTLPSIMKMI